MDTQQMMRRLVCEQDGHSWHCVTVTVLVFWHYTEWYCTFCDCTVREGIK